MAVSRRSVSPNADLEPEHFSKLIPKLSKPKRKFSDLLLHSCVPVVVEETTFYVHEQLLKVNSVFMATALESPLKEGVEKKISLPKEDPTLFRYFLCWLYRKSPKAYDSAEFNIELLTDLIRLYCLGDRLQAEGFKEFICKILSKRWISKTCLEPGDNDILPDLIDATEILVEELPEIETDKMQRWLLGVFGARCSGPNGWQQSVYFRRRLKENNKFEAGLTSQMRTRMLSVVPEPEMREILKSPSTNYEHDLS